MKLVRPLEQQAEAIAHLLDDTLRIPLLGLRFGADPLIGIIPLAGDVVALLVGSRILFIARRLQVSWYTLARMAFNQLKNGLIGSIPFIGDAYSFHFKSHVANATLLLRQVKQGQGTACALEPASLTLQDLAGIAVLTVPTLMLVGAASFWFWDHNISVSSLLFAPTYEEHRKIFYVL